MQYTNQKSNQRKNQGFTLIELMISLFVFSIVMLISVGTLLTLVDVNARAQALYSATTNLSFALDSMTREMRMGYEYHCTTGSDPSSGQSRSTSDCVGSVDGQNEGSGRKVFFTRSRDGIYVGYRLNSGKIEQKVGNVAWTPITSDDVTITNFAIEVNNTDTYEGGGGDTDQPWVDIKIRGYVTNGLDTNTDFNLQTRIVQRRLDVI